MFIQRVLFAGIGLSMLLASSARAAERPKVDVECKATKDKLVYACMFAVKGRKSGNPIDGAKFTVGADMPSMPMAHNIKPITPAATGKPGMYHGNLHLEMTGEWALRMKFEKPVRDVVIKKLMFGDAAGHHAHGRMDHSKRGTKK